VDGVRYDFGFQGEVAVSEMETRLVNTTAILGPDVLLARGNVEQLNLSGADRFEYYTVLSHSSRAGLKGGFEL
jgi:hypothetical protein